MNEITPERFDQLAAGAEPHHTTVHHLPAHLGAPMNEIPEHLRRSVRRIVDGSTFTAGGPVTNSDPAGVLHIPRSLLDAAKNSGSIDDLVRLIETNAAWDADGPVIPPRIVIDDDLDAALMAAAHEADERESEARYELSVARLDHWASTFRNCPDDHQFTDDELDQLSYLLTWAANQISAATPDARAEAAEARKAEPGLEDIVDAVMDAIDATISQARNILDRVDELLHTDGTLTMEQP